MATRSPFPTREAPKIQSAKKTERSYPNIAPEYHI